MGPANCIDCLLAFMKRSVLKTRHFLTIWFLPCQLFYSWPPDIYHFSLKKGGRKVEDALMLLKNCGRLIISLCIPFALQQWIEMAEHQLLSLPQGLSQLRASVIPVFQVPSAPLHQQPHTPISKKHLSRGLQSFSLGIFNNWLEEINGPSSCLWRAPVNN